MEDEERGVPTDPISDMATRFSMHSRRSAEYHRRSLSGSIIFSPGGVGGGPRDTERLMHRRSGSLSGENVFGLSDLAEDEEEEAKAEMGANGNGYAMDKMNGIGKEVHVPKLRSPR